MKRIVASLLMVGLVLLFYTPAFALNESFVDDWSALFVVGGVMLVLGIFGNRRFIKR